MASRVDIMDLAGILFIRLGGIQTQDGRIVKGLMEKINVQQEIVKGLQQQIEELRNPTEKKVKRKKREQ